MGHRYCWVKPQTNWASVDQGTLELYLPQIRKCHFFEWHLPFWMYLLRKGAYRDISHIILKHTQWATSWYQKYLHRRKGGSYDSYKYVSTFRRFHVQSPLRLLISRQCVFYLRLSIVCAFSCSRVSFGVYRFEIGGQINIGNAGVTSPDSSVHTCVCM